MKTRNFVSRTLLLGAVVAVSPFALAGNAWYWGKVTQIISYGADGSFTVYVDNATIKNDCAYDRVTFAVSDMGAERTKIAFSMALAAKASGDNWGVVLDIQNSGDECFASANASQGAGIN